MRALFSLFLVTVCTCSYAQHYYYNSESGERFLLREDRAATAVIISGNTTPEAIRISLTNAPGKTVSVMKDETRSMLVPSRNDGDQGQQVEAFYAEVSTEQPLSPASYQQQMQQYKALPGVQRVSPCFSTEGGERACLSDHFYVKLRDEADLPFLYEEAQLYGLKVLGRNKFLSSWFTLACSEASELNALEAANLFFEGGGFAGAEPEFVYHPAYESVDPDFVKQWGLKNTGQLSGVAGIDVRAESAWTLSKGKTAAGVPIKVGIFDSGVLKTHPDLSANWAGENNSTVADGHGTAVAGIVGAAQNNSKGGSGIAPEVALYSITAAPQDFFTPQVLVNGFDWAFSNGIDVLNLSWRMGGYSQIVKDAIEHVLFKGRNGKGIVVSASAGNMALNMDEFPHYPSSYLDDILVVGAISSNGIKASFSNFGTELDIVAPGVNVWTTDITTSGYVYFGGTSSASPFVAGTAALVLSVNPDLTSRQVGYILEQTARKIRTDQFIYSAAPGRTNGSWNINMGYGLLSAYDACVMALSGSCESYEPVRKFSEIVHSGTPPVEVAAQHIIATGELRSETQTTFVATTEIIFEEGFTANTGSELEMSIIPCLPVDSNIDESLTSRESAQPRLLTTSHSDSHQSALAVSPNPFNDEMKVTYTVDKAQNVSLILVDAMGVGASSEIFSDYANAGTYTITISTASLPAGIYVLKLSNQEGVQALRVIRK